MSRSRHLAALVAALLILPAPLAAGPPGLADEVRALETDWAHAAFEIHDAKRKGAALARLEAQTADLIARHPGRAEPLLIQGLILGEQITLASIFRKLGLAERARRLLTRAYAIDPRAAHGAAPLGLGVLYAKVPGAPIGFGDRARARRLLREALALDPGGLDTNYFYADFLLSQGDKTGASTHALRGLAAAPDAARPVWDAGRRRELRRLLARAK